MDDGPSLPTKVTEEFRPFIRRLPEFKFWYSVSKSTVIALVCTFFEVFNVPVFWPILVMYFITLFCLTMKRQIKVLKRRLSFFFYVIVIEMGCLIALPLVFQHMIKYRYLPFTHSKPKYQAVDGSMGAVPKKTAN